MTAPSSAILDARARARATELKRILSLLARHHGNHSATAAALGYSVDTLHRRLRAAGYTAEIVRAMYPIGPRQPPRHVSAEVRAELETPAKRRARKRRADG